MRRWFTYSFVAAVTGFLIIRFKQNGNKVIKKENI